MTKRIIALFLSMVLLLSTTALAYDTERDFVQGAEVADNLYQLGLVKGVAVNADGAVDHGLSRELTKIEMIALLIRLLGKDTEAVSMAKNHPFTDVPSWADGYATFAYQNGLINGISATVLGANDKATDTLYHTVLLRALGYTDAEYADFSWDDPYNLAYYVGIRPQNLQDQYILRIDALIITEAALFAEFKSTDTMLYEKLISDGIITAEKFTEIYGGENPYENQEPYNVYLETNDTILRSFSSYDEIGHQFAEHYAKVVFTTDKPISKFELYSIKNVDFTNNQLSVTLGDLIGESTTMSPDSAVVTWLTFGDVFPNTVAAYTDLNGNTEYLSIHSGGLEHSQIGMGEVLINFG